MGSAAVTAALGLCAAVTGLALSVYTKSVSAAKSMDLEYQALCDINEYISCSKIFTSRYGYGFGILQYLVGEDSNLNMSNSIFGIAFYLMHLIGILLNRRSINIFLFWSSVLSILMCMYLAYILAYILHDFCVVCVTTYVVNVILLVINYLRMQSDSNRLMAERKRK